MTVAEAMRANRRGESVGIREEKGGHRFFDAAAEVWMVKVLPGNFYISGAQNEMIVTVLGSCVSACIRDPLLGIGGLNHFMLAGTSDSSWGNEQQSMRYGIFAMEKLINELLKAGCARERLEVKLFGGANVTDTQNDIGAQNAEFALRYLRDEGLNCAARDLGGNSPRRIIYSPPTGKVVRRLLGNADRDVVVREESAYAKTTAKQDGGSVELFGKWRR
jgi:chemotaxis protein CheD